MPKKISAPLLRELRAADKAEPGREFPFIVTLKPGTSAATVEARGLKVQHHFESISAIVCSLTLKQAVELSGSDAVERVEYDGEVRALRPTK